jgi:5-(carboxyamino)imidazole ribonucleotide mutase
MKYDQSDELKVAIIMGSDSDLLIMKEAAELLDKFKIKYELTIVSAHRTPERLFEFSRNAHSQFQVIIAGAGGAAHLPGMVASLTTIPVIGVPIKSSTLSGIDSLYSIVQMPKGIVVATVAINNAFNAGLLATEILALKDSELKKRLVEFRTNQTIDVEIKVEKLEKEGYKKFLEN